ncbi:alpha-2B adrenergic receptor-like [Dendronephthya gigantea]|uniref:alpha-2B adrenergic receptor-like n=1 Tax=Dendronephthya gigantea TaxID=151771 RepID=UPI00106B292E|nr:alpha-2B adrenergic receptor-like [Dendronephthya gigantea]
MSGLTESYLLELRAFLERLSLGEKIVSIFLAIFIILGNGLVLIATWRERSLHQPNKYFIACLAVADLLVGLFLAPLKVYLLDFNIEALFSIPYYLCRFMMWIDTFALVSSVYTLTFISCDRYLKISKPLQYKSRMTTSRSLKVIFVIVLISITLATYSATPDSGADGILTKLFYLCLLIIGILLPTTIILIMYALVFRVAHERNKMLANGELDQTINQRTALRRDMKVIRMLLVVIGVFIFCWGPLFTWTWLLIYHPNLIIINSDSLSRAYRMLLFKSIVFTLPFVNSLCNPIIYACLDQTYREAFKRLFQRMMCQRDQRRQQPPIELR